MAKIKQPSTRKWIALGDIQVSERAQREFREYRVNSLVANFDPALIGHPSVSFRGGHYFNVDGQHRVAALIAWLGEGWQSQTIECNVYEGLSEAQEADLFLSLNDTLHVGIHDKFSVAVVAGRKVECEVKRTVESEGLVIARGKTPGSISAVGTLLKIFKRSNSANLARTLRIARDAYGDAGMDSYTLDGLAHLCQRYNGALKEAYAVEKLASARGGVKGLSNRAQQLKLKTGNSMPICVAAAAVDIINAGRRKKMLPSWWK